MYLIIATPDVKLPELQKQTYVILNTRIKWERHMNKRSIIQCIIHCQSRGHATTNCYYKPACLKCTEPHPTAMCDKLPEIEPTCVNCNQTETNPWLKNQQNQIQQQQLQQQQSEPSVINTQGFPRLPRTQPEPTASQKQPQPPPSTTVNNESYVASNINYSHTPANFNTLLQKLRTLGGLMDINQMIAAVSSLKNTLRVLDTTAVRFQAYIKFLNNLDKFNICPDLSTC